VRHFPSAREQAAFLAASLKERNRQGVPLGDICVVARTNREVDAVAEGLRGQGIGVERIGRDALRPARPDVVRVATMHRVKGLEFDEMVLAGMNEGLVPQ